MRDISTCDVVIVSVDPGMAGTRKTKTLLFGKPLAAVAVAFFGDEAVLIAHAVGGIRKADTLIEKLQKWEDAVRKVVRTVMVQHRAPVIMFAIEDARGPGATGWNLQALVVHLVEQWNRGTFDMDTYYARLTKPARVIHHAVVKKLATGDGAATSEEVANIVLMTVLNTEALPELTVDTHTKADHDYEAAISVALAAHAQIKLERMGAME